MLRFIGWRLVLAVPTLLIVTLFVFSLQKLLPGDPVLTLAGEERDPQVLEYLREKYRLKRRRAFGHLHTEILARRGADPDFRR
jgi:peptide/nickel transport system permease protein